MKKNKGHRKHKHYKLYFNSNDLMSTHYVVIDRNVAICTTIVKKDVYSYIELENKIKDFPNNLGYYPQIELLYELNEINYNVYGYRVFVEFDNNDDIIDFVENELPEHTRINDEIIKMIHNYLFKIEFDEPEIDDENYELSEW